MTADDSSLPAAAERLLLFLAAQEWTGPVPFLPSAAAAALSMPTREVVDHYLELLNGGFVSEGPSNALAVVDRKGETYVRAMCARAFPGDSPATPLRIAAERLLAARTLADPTA